MKKHYLYHLLIIALGLLLTCCGAAEQTIIKAADVVNEVAKRGDQIDAVSVQTCNEAEKVAVKLPDIEMAEVTVEAIRKNCDVAFAAVDALEEAIKQVDLLFAAVERGDAEVEDLVSAAMGARQAFDRALAATDNLKAYLVEL